MNFRFDEWLVSKLYSIQELLNVSNFNFVVNNEQDFIMPEHHDENTIYIVVKKLSNSISYNFTTQPYQLMILTENNSLEIAQLVFKTLAQTYNYQAQHSNNEWVKFILNEPVVLSNFNQVFYGYRSVLYMTPTLQIMENVGDIENIKINDELLNVLGTAIGYSMTPDTQQMNKADTKNFIASSVKSASGLSITFSIPLIDCNFVKDVLHIINEDTGYNGNNDFVVEFEVLGINFETTMKLASAGVRSTPTEVPTLEVGLVK